MTPPVFLDTSALAALANTRDQWHSSARMVWRELERTRRRAVTTSLILIEVGDGFSRVHFRPLAIELRRRLLRSNRVTIVQMTPELENRSWGLFERRRDKDWSVTDCASIVVMQDHRIREAFSFDQHFEQAGFQLLPGASPEN